MTTWDVSSPQSLQIVWLTTYFSSHHLNTGGVVKKMQGLVSRQDLTILTYSSPHLGNDFLFRVCLVSLDWIDWFIICHMALLTLVISAMLATASGKVTPWQHIDFLPPVIAPPCNRCWFISWDLSDASQRATHSLWAEDRFFADTFAPPVLDLVAKH